MKILKYEKNKKHYWNRVKFIEQIKEKTLSIAEVFYFRYSLLYLFDYVISYLIYLIDSYWVKDRTKKSSNM